AAAADARRQHADILALAHQRAARRGARAAVSRLFDADGREIAAVADAEGGSTIEQPISGFHRDDEGHWVAELACGHFQHVRHDPPWIERRWVTTPEGRQAAL